MQCKDFTKAFGAVYSDGVSLNTDPLVKANETPISVLEECFEDFEGQELEVGMVVKTHLGWEILVLETLDLNHSEHLAFNTYGTYIARGLIIQESECNHCSPYTVRNPKPVAIFDRDVFKIIGKQVPVEKLHKCGDKVTVESEYGDSFECQIQEIDYSNKQFRYFVDFRGVGVWCAESKSKCSLDGSKCNDFWISDEIK